MSAESVARLSLPVGDRDHSQGALDAPVTFVEYGDYNAPTAFRRIRLLRKSKSDWAIGFATSTAISLCACIIRTQNTPQKRLKRPEHKGNSGRCTMRSSNTKAR